MLPPYVKLTADISSLDVYVSIEVVSTRRMWPDTMRLIIVGATSLVSVPSKGLSRFYSVIFGIEALEVPGEERSHI